MLSSDEKIFSALRGNVFLQCEKKKSKNYKIKNKNPKTTGGHDRDFTPPPSSCNL